MITSGENCNVDAGTRGESNKSDQLTIVAEDSILPMHARESEDVEQLPDNVKMCNEYYVSTCCELCRSSGKGVKACPILPGEL